MSEIEKLSVETSGDRWLNSIKRLFIFLPGAFFLFMGSSFLFYAFFEMHWGLSQVMQAMPWLLGCGFMVMFGIGKFKKAKHLALPLSIVGFSFVAFLISSSIGDINGLKTLLTYSMYLLPMVLATPFLIKNMMEDIDEPLGLK